MRQTYTVEGTSGKYVCWAPDKYGLHASYVPLFQQCKVSEEIHMVCYDLIPDADLLS